MTSHSVSAEPLEGEGQTDVLRIAPGTQLGSFVAGEENLGQGGFGQVQIGSHQRLCYPVAIKTLAATSEQSRQRFEWEATIGAQVRSAHLVPVLDAGELADGTPYIVMPLVHGPTLSQVLQSTRLCAGTLIELASDLCYALAALEAVGVVHRDIKPSNIMLDVDSAERLSAKLVDFGVAKRDAPEVTSPTIDGTIVGTPQYMAPEQIERGAIDPRADVYGVGAVLFEAATGRPPHRASSAAGILRRAIQNERPRIRSLAPDLPRGLAELIDSALEATPELRPAGPREMGARLRALKAPRDSHRAAWGEVEAALALRGSVPTLTDAEPLQRSRDPFKTTSGARRSSLLWAMVIAAAGLLAGATGAWAFMAGL